MKLSQKINTLLKYLILFFIFLLPFHAVIITFLKCKIWINTDILRFWKEWIVIFLLFLSFLNVLLKQKKDIFKFILNQKLLLFSLIFIWISFLYIILPDFKITILKLLGFKYDVFFIFCLITWLYLSILKNYLNPIIKTIFTSTLIILWIFLPWYLFWDIEKTSEIIWYSKEVSNYVANSCISFAQNITWWHHRFQWSFWGPIRFWVFLVFVYFVFLWFFLGKIKKIFLILISILFTISIYFTYSKTAILWFIFWIFTFLFFYFLYIKNIKISKKNVWLRIFWIFILLSIFIYIKRDLLLHPWSILERTDNLVIWTKMVIDNPLWYWLWITWPASQLATSNNESLNLWVKKFLVENWYLQILLESWFFWFFIFMFLLFLIFKNLLKIIKTKKDILWIWILTSFLSIIFMWNFTHVFEETRTSFLLFLIIWVYIQKYD